MYSKYLKVAAFRDSRYMGEGSIKTKQNKGDWTLDESAFQGLLEWLDDGSHSDGQMYLDIRGRLFTYFERKNCLTPDELADETLNRVARRLEEEGNIDSETPAKYCYTVARYVFLEYLRRPQEKNVPLEDLPNQRRIEVYIEPDESGEVERKEKMLNCLDVCTGKLEPANRDIIVRYYFGKERAKIENRKSMAERLGISVNALSIRACRIRDKLETCVKACACAE